MPSVSLSYLFSTLQQNRMVKYFAKGKYLQYRQTQTECNKAHVIKVQKHSDTQKQQLGTMRNLSVAELFPLIPTEIDAKIVTCFIESQRAKKCPFKPQFSYYPEMIIHPLGVDDSSPEILIDPGLPFCILVSHHLILELLLATQ